MMFTFLLCICFTSKNRESFFSLLFRYFAKLNIGLLGFDVAQIDKPIWKKKLKLPESPLKLSIKADLVMQWLEFSMLQICK